MHNTLTLFSLIFPVFSGIGLLIARPQDRQRRNFFVMIFRRSTAIFLEFLSMKSALNSGVSALRSTSAD